MTSKNPTTIPRRQLGRQLRELRQAAGLSIADAARLIERGAGTLQRLEKGESPRIRQLDIEALCKVYGVRAVDMKVLKALAAQGDERTRPVDDSCWWQRYDDLIPPDFGTYLSLESAAERVITHQDNMVPGIVQTADYARALEGAAFPGISPMELEQRVQIRIQRQSAITRRVSPVEVDLLIDESVIHRVVGSRKVMSAQRRHLADTPPNVHVRIIPFGAGFPLGSAPGPYVILQFPSDPATRQSTEPTTVYVESYGSRLYYDHPDAVSRYVTAHARISEVALTETDTKHLLRQMA
ncbi:helix-turn-helix domain-containing protein [Nocardia sp. NBC_00565]|uniref:helix-turn-helix domain-containing protein n=1 Tax=Nocardia sp. NBC_00565 TaxID=2975993 RepID=UPI002E81E300|nr:helix-turn-helix transcriptional regulator [Nocardia sp. NBC_00565]WUC05755.1 helix-turn-helix domain-containing protein [Nocardia sp. NBC_00565]